MRYPGGEGEGEGGRARARTSSAHLALDLLLDEVVFAFVVEDDMDLLGAVTTDIRPCADRQRYGG